MRENTFSETWPMSLYEFSKFGKVQVTQVSSSGIAAWVSVDLCSEQPSLAAPVAGNSRY